LHLKIFFHILGILKAALKANSSFHVLHFDP
jgi:hypothetical protein